MRGGHPENVRANLTPASPSGSFLALELWPWGSRCLDELTPMCWGDGTWLGFGARHSDEGNPCSPS